MSNVQAPAKTAPAAPVAAKAPEKEIFVAPAGNLLPACFSSGQSEGGCEKESFSSVPYVGYYGAKATAPTRAECEPAGVKVGQFYLHHVTPIAVDPFGVHWLTHARLYTKRDNRMEVIDCRLPKNREEEDANFKAGFREHIFAVVAVRVPGPNGINFFPALLNLYGGLAACFNKANDLFRDASNDAKWGARGPAYQPGLALKIPGARFFSRISASIEETESGNDFNKGFSVVQPISADDAIRMQGWLADPSTTKILTALARVNDERVKEAKAKVKA